MARLNTSSVSRARTSAEYAEDDDRYDSSEIPHRSKRARLDGDSESDSENPVLPDSYRSRAQNEIDENNDEYAPLKHQPGSIVRVKLTNFVTYSAAEFHLGPSLNMIIGPNGTGKSTLVCAICLGLGWSPQHLGRAKDIADFVKHGAREAQIEIELAAGDRFKGRNPVIKRYIRKEGSKSTFSLNGSNTTQKEIIQLCKSFSIQIDNLCQFLPQDRVVEFAGLSPVALLEQTQKAAARDQMQQWHDYLKRKRANQKQEQATLANEQETLNNLQSRQNLQRADVERMRERADLISKIEAYEKIRPMVKYTRTKEKYQESKKALRDSQAALQTLEAEVNPVLQSVNRKQRYEEGAAEALKNNKEVVKKLEHRAGQVANDLEKLKAEVEQQDVLKAAEIKDDVKRKQDAKRVDATIRDIELQMRQEPPEVDGAAYNQRGYAKQREIRDKQTEVDQLDQQMASLDNQLRPKGAEKRRLQEEIEKLSTESGQQLAKLRKNDRRSGGGHPNAPGDTEKAWEWIEKNRASFVGEVYGPPILTCSVKDLRYASMFEGSLGKGELLSFTYTSKQDGDLLKAKLAKEQGLSIYLRESNRPLDSFVAPVGTDELRRLGLEDWLVNFVSGPDAVLSMLCDNAQINRIAVTLGTHTDSQFDQIVQSGKIMRWTTSRDLCNVTRRREYGAAGTSTFVKKLEPPTIWTESSRDLGQERELQQRVTEIDRDLQMSNERHRELQNQKLELRKQIEEIKQAKQAIEAEKASLQSARQNFLGLRTKLDSAIARKQNYEEQGQDLRRRLADIDRRADRLALEKGQKAINYTNAIQTLIKKHQDMYVMEIMHAEAVSDLEILKSRNAEVNNMLRQRREEVNTLSRKAEELKKETQRLGREVQRIGGEMTEEEKELVADIWQTISAEDLEAEITSLTASLSLFHEGDPNAIRQYEERGRSIATHQEKVTELEENLQRIQEQIDEVKAQWEPELDDLVQQISDAFSYNFEKIGCAGQVGIYKAEDFDQWAIQIQVKFREQEQLSLLDAHRQSGGERAVSTIFYLMALQSLARSPFRVVDEINQGMDPRNERMVHERMVDIACQEHTSQYFLITPKLLHGLKFHPRMMVHCIASGEYMPTNHRDLDLRQLAMRLSGAA